jgi:hypothetical protein
MRLGSAVVILVKEPVFKIDRQSAVSLVNDLNARHHRHPFPLMGAVRVTSVCNPLAIEHKVDSPRAFRAGHVLERAGMAVAASVDLVKF